MDIHLLAIGFSIAGLISGAVSWIGFTLLGKTLIRWINAPFIAGNTVLILVNLMAIAA